MANKRMFNNLVVGTDAFLDMPLSAQALYFHLNLRADDDGFIGNPRRVARDIGSNDDDLKILIGKRFVLEFEDGIIVIKHWRMHNRLSQNRYCETVFLDQKKMLKLKENKAYSFNSGEPIDDSHLIEMSKRQVVDENKTQNRRKIDAQKTHTDIDIDLDLDSDLEEDKDKEKEILSFTNVNDRQTEAVRRVVEEWNKLSELGIKPVHRIGATSTRYKKLNARIKQNGEDVVIAAINRIRNSKFLTGQVNDFIIDFDWFIGPNNFDKVADGKYDNRNQRTVNDSEDKDGWADV